MRLDRLYGHPSQQVRFYKIVDDELAFIHMRSEIDFANNLAIELFTVTLMLNVRGDWLAIGWLSSKPSVDSEQLGEGVRGIYHGEILITDDRLGEHQTAKCLDDVIANLRQEYPVQ